MTFGEVLSYLFIFLFPWIVLFLYWKVQLKAIKKKSHKERD